MTGELDWADEDSEEYDPDRWLQIDNLGSREAHLDMEWFIELSTTRLAWID